MQESAQGEGPAAVECRAILEERPALTSEESIVWVALSELDTCRPLAMAGTTMIPWTAIVEYARYHGMLRNEADVFLQRMLVLDRILVHRKIKQAAAK